VARKRVRVILGLLHNIMLLFLVLFLVLLVLLLLVDFGREGFIASPRSVEPSCGCGRSVSGVSGEVIGIVRRIEECMWK